jgi:NCAIR mutase (PurE)-related protein
MNEKSLRELLIGIKHNQISVDAGLDKLKDLPFEDLGFAKIDHHRQLRKGFPEVIYSAGKTTEQIVTIVEKLAEGADNNILATRANYDVYEAIAARIPDVEYYDLARLIVIRRGEQEKRGHILVLSAGTSDIPVAEEAAITAEVMGNRVEQKYIKPLLTEFIFMKSEQWMPSLILLVLLSVCGGWGLRKYMLHQCIPEQVLLNVPTG